MNIGSDYGGGGGSPEKSFYYRFLNADGISRNLFGSPLPVRTIVSRTDLQTPASRMLGNNGGGGGSPKNLNGSPLMVGLQNITSTPPPGTRNQQRGRAGNTVPLPFYYPSTPLQEIERRRNSLGKLLISLWHDISLPESPNPKKLLNAIDVVEKVVMKEISRIRSSPNAKDAERKL